MLPINQVIHGDCIDELKKLPDNCVDLIINDPPYNINKDKWDKIRNYEAWCLEWILECQRILKDTGSFYIFHNNILVLSKLIIMINSKTTFNLKQLLIWNKKFKGSKKEAYLQGFNEVTMLRNYQKMAEYIVFYTCQDDTGLSFINHGVNNYSNLRNYFRELYKFIGVSKKELFLKLGNSKIDHCFRHNSSQWSLPTKSTYQELINIYHIDKWEKFREYDNMNIDSKSLRQEYEILRYTFNNLKTHHSVMNFEIADKINHITPKPIDLLQTLIKYSSNENDIVLDCFGGSGTTAIACAKNNRKYICIEKEEKYCNIINSRLNKINSLDVFLK